MVTLIQVSENRIINLNNVEEILLNVSRLGEGQGSRVFYKSGREVTISQEETANLLVETGGLLNDT